MKNNFLAKQFTKEKTKHSTPEVRGGWEKGSPVRSRGDRNKNGSGKIVTLLMMIMMVILPSNPLWSQSSQSDGEVGKANSVEVEFIVKNILKQKGQIRLQVIKDEETYETDSDEQKLTGIAMQIVIDVTSSEMKISLNGLKPGTYVAQVFHDINMNGIMDTNAVGVPQEPYGHSKNARATFGQPDFEDAAIEITENGNNQFEIKIEDW